MLTIYSEKNSSRWKKSNALINIFTFKWKEKVVNFRITTDSFWSRNYLNV